MAKSLEKGEHVFVPRSRIHADLGGSSAFYSTKVVDRPSERSVIVSLPHNQVSEPIGTAVVHRKIGVLIIAIGDFNSEDTLLTPLGRSIYHYFRLLLTDDLVHSWFVRSRAEFRRIWERDTKLYSHVVLIGHGTRKSIVFGVDGETSAEEFVEILNQPDKDPKVFVSLCCLTGYQAFASKFSASPVCSSLVAPFHSVHGAIASQFCQSFYTYHMLMGETTRVAFRHAPDAIPGGTHFRLWQDGEMLGGAQA